jgi:tetratricopeptide (TPR) repeat protein
MYKNQALFSLMQVAQLGEGKDNSAPLAMADTCYQRLGAVSPDEPEYSWGMAMVRLAQMQTVAAEAVMTASAKAGYGPAHLWLGQRRLQTPLAQMTPNVLDDAEQHLLRAAAWKKSTDRSPDVEIGARSLLAEIYFQRGRRDQAIEELIKVAGARPELRFKLALWLSLDDKRRDEARTHARSAAEAFQKRVDASIDDHTARFSLIQCHLLLAEFDLAKNHALRGGTLARNSEAHAKYRDDYARLLYQVLIVEYEFQTFEGKSPAERFALLEGALQLFPNDIALLERLMTFFRQPGEQGDKARKVINDLRDSDRFAPLAYMFLGLDAYRNDNSDEARFYWEQALKRSPSDMPLVANNLAWIVATQEPVDLKRALELIETALRAQNASENPHLRSTRGRILARMGRHEEALTDLQKGLPAWLNNPMYVRQLADHYRQLAETSEKLNHTTAAANYKRLADEWAA